MSSGPKRLRETDDGELGRSLSAARSHVPAPGRLRAVSERLAGLGLPTSEVDPIEPTPDAGVSPSPSPSPSNALLAKGIAGVLVTGGVVLTFSLALPSREAETPKGPEARTTETQAMSASPPRAAPPRTTFAPPTSVPAVPAPPEPTSVPAAPAPPEPTSVPAPPRPQTARKAPDPSAADSPSLANANEPPVIAAAPSTGEGQGEAGDARPRARARSEVALLKEAREAVGSDPERALLLTRRYGAEYPHGTYAQERDFIAISALVRLGRREQARSRADAFRERYPRSAYLPQFARWFGAR